MEPACSVVAVWLWVKGACHFTVFSQRRHRRLTFVDNLNDALQQLHQHQSINQSISSLMIGSLSAILSCCFFLLFTPPNIRVGGLIFYQRFFFLFLSFTFRPLLSQLAERHSTKINHMLGRKFILKMHGNLTATLTAYIFGMKHDIHNRPSALTTTRGLLHRLKTTWTLVHYRMQIGP